ncbi:hypothetical protein GCM10010530_39000 [Kribbella aluminosa]
MVDPNIRLATPGGVSPAGDLQPEPGDVSRPANHALEFTAGTEAAGVRIDRSSRITVVFQRKALQHDPHFDVLSPTISAGVGLVSGLNGLGSGRSAALSRVVGVLDAWREAGVPTVHLELAEYRSVAELGEVLAAVAPYIHSIGMSQDEFQALVGPGRDIGREAAGFADHHGVSRVVVHSDRWALSVHTSDPERERLALIAGCLAAACRAESGRPLGRWRVPSRSDFASGIPAETSSDGWRTTVASSPYLTRPHSTIGLGDTFVSGHLLVHAANS